MSSKTDIYLKSFKEDDTPGLDAINRKTKEIYREQESHHWATVIPFELGGEDPLWAVDCFESKKQTPHLHYVSLGFTNLFFDDSLAEDEVNGFGFELTFRHTPVQGDPEKPMWPANLLQNLAKYVFETKNVFEPYHRISANGPLRLETETEITAIVFYTDPELGIIDTPHGQLHFLQIFGITTQEYNDLVARKYNAKDLIDRHLIENPLLITDLSRKS